MLETSIIPNGASCVPPPTWSLPWAAMDPYAIAGVDEEREHQRLLDTSIEWLSARGVKTKGYLAHGNTIQQIVGYSRKLAVDLIVIGHYPSPEGRRWWSGPERASLAEQVNCCIFIAVNADGTPTAA